MGAFLAAAAAASTAVTLGGSGVGVFTAKNGLGTYGITPPLASRRPTRSDGCAPTASQYLARSRFRETCLRPTDWGSRGATATG